MEQPGLRKEEGYTFIPNEALDRVIQSRINGAQKRILFVLWRYTYGCNQKNHGFSEKFISSATGMSKRHISRELNKLIGKNIVTVVVPYTNSRPRVLSFNENYDKWEEQCGRSDERGCVNV